MPIYALVGNAFVGLAEFAVSQLALVVNQPVGAVGAIGYVVVGFGTLVNRCPSCKGFSGFMVMMNGTARLCMPFLIGAVRKNVGRDALQMVGAEVEEGVRKQMPWVSSVSPETTGTTG